MKFVKKSPLVDKLDRERAPYKKRPYDISSPLDQFEMHAFGLIWPYHLHTYLMYMFLEFYECHRDLYCKRRSGFYRAAENEPFFQFGLRVKPKQRKTVVTFIDGMIELHETIRRFGFSEEKRIPVARNPEGRIIPLKGAKRLAICLALGQPIVPVVEYEVEVGKLKEDKRNLFLRDYTKLIRRDLWDIPQVRVAIRTFENLPGNVMDSYVQER